MGEKCHACGRELKKDEPFVLEGGYPSPGSKILKPMAHLDMPSQTYQKSVVTLAALGWTKRRNDGLARYGEELW